MPTTRRRRTRHLAPSGFADIDAGERVRWSLGTPLIEGEFTPALYAEGSSLPCWASWEAWAETYAVCRDAFLAYYAIRHPGQEPGSEVLFRAYQKGQNPADVEVPRPPDPRRVLMGRRVEGWN